MKISELQEKLESIKSRYGDLECTTHADGSISSLGWVKAKGDEVHLIDSMGYDDEWNFLYARTFGIEPR